MPLFRDSALEMRELREARALRHVQQAFVRRSGFDDPEVGEQLARVTASSLVDHVNAYPWQDAGVSLELAANGVGPDDDLARELATEEVERSNERRIENRSLRSTWRSTTGPTEPSPIFDDDGNYVGDENLSPSENDTLLRQIEHEVAGGADRSQIYAGLRDGSINALEITDATREHFAPYEALLNLGGGQGLTDEIVQKIYALPRSVAEELAAEEWDVAEGGQVLSRNRVNELPANTATAPGYDARMSLSSVLNDVLESRHGSDWREQVFALDQDSTAQERKVLFQRLQDAARARGEDVDVQYEDGGGGLLGNITRPLVAATAFGPQFFTNSLRQNVNSLTSGLGQGLSMGSTTQDPIQAPTLASGNLSPVSGSGTAALDAAGGYAGVYRDVIQTAAALGPVGGAARAAIAVTPDALEAGFTPGGFSEEQREAAGATDLGVMVSRPDLAGDGLLLSADAIRLRQEREAAFSPTFDNGEMLTFGRGLAAAVGLDAGTQPFNVLSGAVDFGVALTGPGEFAADGIVAGARNVRRLPGARAIPLVGAQDPLAEAGGIASRFRNAVLPQQVSDWVDGWRGRRVTASLAEMDNVDDVRMAFRGRIDVASARTIADMGEVDDIADFLKLHMGNGIGATPRLGRVTGWRGTLRNVDTFASRVRSRSGVLGRLSDELPAGEFNLDDLDDTYSWAASFMANASIPRAEAREILDRLARTSHAARGAFILNEVSGLVNTRTFARLMNRQERSLLNKVIKAGQGSEANAARRAILEERAQARADRLTRHFVDRTEGLARYFVDEVGTPGYNPFMRLADGTVSELPRPHSILEHHRGRMTGPDIHNLRDLRRLNGPAYSLFSRPGLAAFESAVDGLTLLPEALTAIWKPLVLLRPAYVTRVVGEEQARIAAAGGDSLANNPLGWLVWTLTGRSGRNADLRGSLLSESAEFAGVQVGDGVSVLERLGRQADLAHYRTSVYDLADQSMPNFNVHWAGEISQLASDPLVARVAASPNGVTDDLIDEILADDDLLEQIYRLGSANSDTEVGQALMRFRDGPGTRSDPAFRSAVNDLLRSYDERIRVKTGGSRDLREAIAVGTFGDDAVRISDPANPSTMVATDEFAEALIPYIEAFAPTQVKALKNLTVNIGAGTPGGRAYRTFLDVMGGAIIEKPTSVLSRSPVFRQNYWAFVDTHAANLTPDAARQALDNLPKAGGTGLPRDLHRSVTAHLRDAIAKGEGQQTLDGFDLAAKAFAMEKTNDLLFAMTTKQQWSDSLRVIAPFAEAWAEVLQTWGRLAATNPNLPRRLQQTKTVLGDPGLAESLSSIPGWEVIDGQGLIHTDDYGQEMILVPWANAAGDMLAFLRQGDVVGALQRPFSDPVGPSGIQRPQQAVPLNALNVGAGILPGLGPAVAIPLARILPEAAKGQDLPAGGELRDILFPFGEPTDDILDPAAMLGEFLPSWVKYFTAGFTGDAGSVATAQEINGYEGRVIAAAQYIIANDRDGVYDIVGRGQPAINELLDDAKDLAGEIALAQMFSAVTISPGRQQFFIYDEDGNVQMGVDDPNASTFLTTLAAASLFREFTADAQEQGMNYEDASAAAYLKLVEATGTSGSVFATLGLSRSRLPGGAPVTKEAYDWLQENSAAPEDAELTWGLFAPQEEGEFYAPMYQWGIAEGDRQRLTSEEWGRMAEDLVADFLYDEAVRGAERAFPDGLDDDAKLQLAEYREDLRQRFPNWRQMVIAPVGNPTTAIDELGRVTSEGEIFGDHEFAQDVQFIYAARADMIAAIREAGISEAEVPHASSTATQWYRQQFNDYLLTVEERNPALGYLIDRTFRAEMREGLEKDVVE